MEASAEHDDLIATLRTALRSKDPTAFAALVSSMLSVTDLWSTGDHDADSTPFGTYELVESFVHTPYAETTAALHVIAALLPDELDATRVRRAVATRRHPVPPPVLGLRDIEVTAAAKLGDELGDGDNIIIGLTWPGVGGATVVTYVDEAFGTRVKDVLVIPEAFDEVCTRYGELLADSGRRPSELHEVTTADARASIQRAIDLGEAVDAPLTPEDWSGPDGDPLGWPAARPFVELLLRRMPPGGTSVLTSSAQPEVSVADAVKGFLASPHARNLDAPGGDRGIHDGVRDTATLLAQDAEGWAGHPLRWSPVQVELALTQRLPWALEASEEALDGVGSTLPAFIRYAHARLAVAADATAETLAAVDQWLPSYDALRQAGPAARWRELGSMIEAFEHGDVAPLTLHSLAEEVGGQDALDTLDAEPLPREDPVLDGLPLDVRDTVVEIAALADQWLTSSPRVEHLGALREEWRTAARRMLVGATTREPGWLRRRASAPGRACGLLWATGVANRLVGRDAAVLAKDLAADFGVSGSPATKAEALLRAWGVERWGGSDVLGDAGLLVSSRRAQIIAERDQYRA